MIHVINQTKPETKRLVKCWTKIESGPSDEHVIKQNKPETKRVVNQNWVGEANDELSERPNQAENPDSGIPVDLLVNQDWIGKPSNEPRRTTSPDSVPS